MTTDMFDGPGSADQFSPSNYEGRLLLIKPLQQLHGINTANGPKDAVEADIHILDGDGAGTALRGAYIFPLVLQGQVRSNIGTGRFNLGRLGKGSAKPGQNAPWVLRDPTDADKDLARRYLASDKFKQNNAAAEPTPAAAAPASDPWGSSGDEPPF